ncbi:MAG: S-layer homology domain-containing protein [Proteocatella sp.]
MRVTIKRRLASFLVLVMVLTSVIPAYAATGKKSKNDIAGHWAENDILAMVNSKIIGGYPDGSMKPDRYVTIAETVKIMNKAFNIVGTGDVYSIPYTDVSPYEWYSGEIALAAENGYLLSIAPGQKLKPNAPATREQIGAMFAQVMGLETKDLDSIKGFSDVSKITPGYNYYFAAAVKEGLFAGYPDNTLKPQATVTRGIMAAVTNRAMMQNQPAELHQVFVGPNDILIDTPGSVLSNRTVDNLWISESVAEGNVTLDNVKVRGKLVIKGGGPKSVIVKGDSDIPLVYMEKEKGDLRLKVEKPAIVGTVNVNAGSKNYITGDVESLILNTRRGQVDVEKSKIKSIEVKAEDADLYTNKDCEVSNITVSRSATNAYMSLDGKVSSLVISAPFTKTQAYGKINSIYLTYSGRASEIIAEKKSQITTVKTDADRVSIRGGGEVSNAIINGNDCKIDTVPTKVQVDKNASGTTSNGKPIAGGSTGTTTPGGGVDGGTVGPLDPNAKVSSMEVTKYPATEKLVYTVGDTLNLDGLEVTFKYSNGATASVPLADFSKNSISIDPNPNGTTKVLATTKTVKITHVPTGKSATLNLTVKPIPKVKDIMIMTSPKTTYVDGELLDLNGMELLLMYDNETTTSAAFKLTTVNGKPSNSFKDMGIETSISHGTPLTLKRPGTTAESKNITVSFRNSDNTVISTKNPLFVNINPLPRISAVSASGYKFSYIYGDKFDFTNLEVRLVSSNPDLPQIELRYIPALKDFVVKKLNTTDDQYTTADLYKTVAPNGDILREVKLTQSIANKDVLVEQGTDVGLGNTDNIKVLKITHNAKDVAPAYAEVNIQIKPPSKAVSATVTGLGVQFEEGAPINMKDWDITVFRDSIVNQNPNNPQASDSTKVLYGTSTTSGAAKLYEYTSRTDQNTWKPYNYSIGDTFRSMQILVMQQTASGSIIPGPDLVTSPDYKWQRKDVAIKIIHSESGVRLDANGNPIPTSYNNVQLAYIPIVVKPEKGVELFELLVDPTQEGTPPKTKMFLVDDPLDIKSLTVLLKEYGKDSENIVFGDTGTNFTAKGIKVTLLLKDGITEIGSTNSDLNGITLNKTHDGAKLKISILDGGQPRIIYSKELKVRTKIKGVDIYTITPKVGEIPRTTLAPNPEWYPEYGSESISWIGELDVNGRFKSGVSYQALIKLRAKSGYTFYGITASDVLVDNINGVKIPPESGSFILSEDYETITFRVKFSEMAAVSSFVAPSPVTALSYTEPTKYTDVATATEFYNALKNPSVAAIRVTKSMTLAQDTVVNKPVTVVDGAVLSYSADAPASGRKSGISDKKYSVTKQFRITGNGTILIKPGAVLNKAGKGDFRVDNGGKIIVEGTLANAGTKTIGKQGTKLKTYGTATIVITGSSSGPVMTLEGSADLLQSLSLEQNLVVSPSAKLNVKKGTTLTANNNISINNKGTINVEDNAMIVGTGKYTGERPNGNFLGGFVINTKDPIKYGSKSTTLDQTQNGSEIKLALNVPKGTSVVYLRDTFVNATDVRSGTYALKGNGAITTAVIEIDRPSPSTGLSRVYFGYRDRGIIIPSNASSGKYVLSGVIGGANVVLEITID